MITTAFICLVVGITDGDTIKARCGQPGAYHQIKIRLSAIDAPEKKQPFGEASRKHLSDLCFKVEAKITPRSTDRYKRMVADVECKGADVGSEQVRSGLAWVYDKYSKGHEFLYQLQDEARTAQRGLWSQPHEPPWLWRKHK